jgi:hypothetical protein
MDQILSMDRFLHTCVFLDFIRWNRSTDEGIAFSEIR